MYDGSVAPVSFTISNGKTHGTQVQTLGTVGNSHCFIVLAIGDILQIKYPQSKFEHLWRRLCVQLGKSQKNWYRMPSSFNKLYCGSLSSATVDRSHSDIRGKKNWDQEKKWRHRCLLQGLYRWIIYIKWTKSNPKREASLQTISLTQISGSKMLP